MLSPNDKASAVTLKITNYLKGGVDLVWVIDPESRTVTVYRRDRAPYTLAASEELSGDDILPDFRCRIADLFFLPKQFPQGG